MEYEVTLNGLKEQKVLLKSLGKGKDRDGYFIVEGEPEDGIGQNGKVNYYYALSPGEADGEWQILGFRVKGSIKNNETISCQDGTVYHIRLKD